MRNALIVSLLVVVLGNTAWGLSVAVESTYPLAVAFQYASPVIAPFLCVYLTKKNKWLSGGIAAIFSITGFVLGNVVFESLGNQVDFPGSQGALLVAMLSAPYCLIAALVGGAAGALCARYASRSQH